MKHHLAVTVAVGLASGFAGALIAKGFGRTPDGTLALERIPDPTSVADGVQSTGADRPPLERTTSSQGPRSARRGEVLQQRVEQLSRQVDRLRSELTAQRDSPGGTTSPPGVERESQDAALVKAWMDRYSTKLRGIVEQLASSIALYEKSVGQVDQSSAPGRRSAESIKKALRGFRDSHSKFSAALGALQPISTLGELDVWRVRYKDELDHFEGKPR